MYYVKIDTDRRRAVVVESETFLDNLQGPFHRDTAASYAADYNRQFKTMEELAKLPAALRERINARFGLGHPPCPGDSIPGIQYVGLPNAYSRLAPYAVAVRSRGSDNPIVFVMTDEEREAYDRINA